MRMKYLVAVLISLAILAAGCSSKVYTECKNPVKIKGKIYCEK